MPRVISAKPLRGLVLAVFLSFSACDSISYQDRIGVSLEDGHVVIQFVLCPGEKMQVVRLGGPIREDTEVGEEPTLWEIHSESGSDQEAFVIGRVPPGFRESVHLRGELPPGLLSADVQTSTVPTGIAFKLSQLSENEVWIVDETLVSQTEFRERAIAACGTN